MSNLNSSSSSFPGTPRLAIDRLMEGNQRFVSGTRSVDSMMAHLKMPELAAKGQKPFAVVLTCSDSRSPVELIFDQGLGDLFVVRVAGNVVAPSLLASMEFAVANFGSPLILVLGHSQCGAVNATIQHTKDPSNPLPSPHLEELVARIRPAVEATQLEHSPSRPEFLQHATVANIYRSMGLIHEQSKIIRQLVDSDQLMIAGALLDISTGKVGLL